MLQTISNQQKIIKKNGGFGIEVLFPGKGIGSDDPGIGTIGRIDQARVTNSINMFSDGLLSAHFLYHSIPVLDPPGGYCINNRFERVSVFG